MDKFDDTDLDSGEIYWRDHQKWLEGHGYMLRPRYRPGWIPSWIGTNIPGIGCEDGPSLEVRTFFVCKGLLLNSCQLNPVMDATRISDGKLVMLKQIRKSLHPFEIEIAQFLSSEPQASDPRNHSVPILEVLQDPEDEDLSLLVMPFLKPYDKPKFDTIGEAIECFRQLFEVCTFFHFARRPPQTACRCRV
jgi:hypothetical protein